MSYFSRFYNAPGSAPGVLDAPSSASTNPFSLHRVAYTADDFQFHSQVDITALAHSKTEEKCWIAVQGRPTVALLEAFEQCFGLHRLALEDVLHAGQRPKMEDYDHHLFVVLQRPLWRENKLVMAQVSLFVGEHFIISIDESGEDSFAPVRRRMETSPGGRIRSSPIDYLFYALVDLIVDEGFPVLESYAQALEELELAIMQMPSQGDALDQLHEIRRELVFFRRALWTQRDTVNALLLDDQTLISEKTRLYLRDCADHASHILELADSYRDMCVAVMELLLSSQNRQLNETMRVLTMIATIFIPLSFVVGIYGMNFSPEASPWNMPELSWRYGYPMILLVLLGIGGGMLYTFKRKGWF